jgi:putative protease
MADPGLIDLVRETWPEMPVHLSVQANTVNFAAVRFWQKLGIHADHPVARTVARRSRRDPPGMPGHRTRGLRARRAVRRLFGRCLLSGYFNHRDPNQGTCTNSCRWDYKLKPAERMRRGDVRRCRSPASGRRRRYLAARGEGASRAN